MNRYIRVFISLAALALIAQIGAKRGDRMATANAKAASSKVFAAPPAAATTTAAAKPALPDVLIGDASLAGKIDLRDKRVVDGHYQAPIAGGGTAVLTLEPRLQRAAMTVLKKAKAPLAAIVLSRPDGRIVALAGVRNAGKVRDLSLPTTTWAPAASIFKIVTTAALLEAGVSPSAKVCYHGGVRSVRPSNLTDSAHDNQCADLSAGLSRSQNAIMAKLAHRHLSRDKLLDAAHRLGFDNRGAFALDNGRSRVTLPSGDLEFARVAAGFWNTELSPLTGATLATAVATGGLRVTPRVVSQVVRGDRTIPVVGAAPTRVLSKEIAGQVRSMMVKTCTKGTARRAFADRKGRRFLPSIDVAGKTGSLSRKRDRYLSYSWFVGFAPADNPQYIVSVLLGNGEIWHIKAHTAARLLLQKALAQP